MMRWILERRLRSVQAKADPQAAFVASMRAGFMQRIQPTPWYAKAGMRYGSVAATMVLTFGAGTGAYAYTSDTVLPDHPLYPLREELEHLELRLQPRAEVKARIMVKHAERRVRELELLSRAKKPLPPAVRMERFTNAVEAAITASAQLPTSTQKRVDATVSALEHAQIKQLVRNRDEQTATSTRADMQRVIEKETERMQKRVERMQEVRQKQFEKQTKRAEALQQRLELRLERDRLRAVPPISAHASSGQMLDTAQGIDLDDETKGSFDESERKEQRVRASGMRQLPLRRLLER
jgi:hypothetical protein